VDAAETALENRFGSADVLSAVLNAGRFIEMSEAEQKRLLAQVVDAGKVDISEEISDVLRALNEEQPTLASVGTLRPPAEGSMTRVRRRVALSRHWGKWRSRYPIGRSVCAEVMKKLEDLRQQKERLVAQKAEVDTSWESAQTRLKQLKMEIEEVSLEILDEAKSKSCFSLSFSEAMQRNSVWIDRSDRRTEDSRNIPCGNGGTEG